jgi:phage terminase large subunit-like protein
MVRETIRQVDSQVAVKLVHASAGKRARAEPIAALYEQGKVSHLGVLGTLEDQCCHWVPSQGMASPDRLDALVWAMTELSRLGTVGAILPGGAESRSKSRISSTLGHRARPVLSDPG